MKKDFPIYKTHPNLVYLDTAASSQTPNVVIDAMDGYYREYRSNVHRGLYPIGNRATEQFEQARQTVAEYLNAAHEEIVFTSGVTQALNMLASGLGRNVWKGSNVVLTRLEHHSNLVPWQQAATQFGFELRFIELTSDGKIDLDSAAAVIDDKTQVVSFAWISNAIGTRAPAAELIALAKKHDAISIVDAAQVAGHEPVDVKALECDFLVFSGHKMYGPTGIGVLYGKKERLDALEPTIHGGEMIEQVSYDDASWAAAPAKFEAGTPNIAGAIGLATAFVYLDHLRWDEIQAHEEDLKKYLLTKLRDEVEIIGPQLAQDRGGVVSFTIPNIHPHDIAEILGGQNICVRAGHHCAMPLMKQLGISGTTRASLGLYNTRADVDALMAGIQHAKDVFKK